MTPLQHINRLAEIFEAKHDSEMADGLRVIGKVLDDVARKPGTPFDITSWSEVQSVLLTMLVRAKREGQEMERNLALIVTLANVLGVELLLRRPKRKP
jgi:hypothetical protein